MARATRKTPGALPLRLRLPNPPAALVGRDEPRQRLSTLIDRAPVSSVVGPAGVGKTALVLDVLHRERDVDRCLYLAIHDGESALEVRTRVLSALGDAERDAIDLAASAAQPDTAFALAIDLAERGPWTVMIDDVHHAEGGPELEGLMEAVARYARRSRWVITSRIAPRSPALASGIVSVDGMSEEALLELGAQLAPSASRELLRRAASSAAGSPWLLAQHLAGDDRAAVERQRILGSLDARSAELLRLLAVSPEGLSSPLLGALVQLPDDDALERMQRRGLLAERGERFRLHDVVRSVLLAPGPEVAGDVARARALVRDAACASTDPADVLVGMELCIERSELDRVEQLLERHGETLLVAGHAPRLWRVLGRAPRGRLREWRLRTAAELGNPTVLEAITAPAAADVDARLIWARTRVLRGEHDDAARAVASLLETASPAARSLARRVQVRALLLMGKPRDALALARSAASDEDTAALRALAARCMAALGDEAGVEDAEAQIASLTDAEPRLDMIAALLELGRARDAEAWLDATPTTASASSDAFRLFSVREATLLRARARLELGHLDDAAALAEEVRPFARSASLQRASLAALDLALSVASGDLAGMLGRVEHALIASACDAGAAQRAREAALLWAVRVGASIEQLLSRASAQIDASQDTELDALRLEHVLRWGSGEPPRAEPAALRTTRRAAMRRRLVDATRTLIEGDAVSAGFAARELLREAERAPLPWLALDAERLLADAVAAEGDVPRLTEVAGAWLARARASSLAAVEAEAELLVAHGSPGALERLAARDEPSPIAARRARALLDASARLDRVDELVVTALGALGGARRIEPLVPGSAWAPGWGIDEPRASVWLEDGQEIALAKTPLLLRVLVVLADHGGAATKEALVMEAWGERDYHPLRHDARMQMAIRKLREKIEHDPSSPTRLLTTADGYALAGQVRRVRLS